MLHARDTQCPAGGMPRGCTTALLLCSQVRLLEPCVNLGCERISLLWTVDVGPRGAVMQRWGTDPWSQADGWMAGSSSTMGAPHDLACMTSPSDSCCARQGWMTPEPVSSAPQEGERQHVCICFLWLLEQPRAPPIYFHRLPWV